MEESIKPNEKLLDDTKFCIMCDIEIANEEFCEVCGGCYDCCTCNLDRET